MQNSPRLAAAILIAALTLSACATTRDPSPLSDASNVALGQQAYADGPIIQPVAVLEDSRCPMNARCVWAGRVRVYMLWFRGNGEQQPFEVTLGEATPLADGSITLESVRPDKMTNVELKPQDYRFAFRFAGGI
ncbi:MULTISPECIES: hypothetical protein [unclassified Sphingopyxis]|uniref:hypothetical protein n=1 Tax=unclassified Sphingopyxis TaxID=2614943 RepID=UPI002863A839|nr:MULTISPECIES: hypothetical protein [unclassified Sphingopyxis]MDR6835162.1 hypothetical protein [Sphingopyxis sp. BE122]MDR7227383.1 hypothetical protein [Sphingopyxis sp. BE259]